jgi:hypothetical protein
MTPSHRQGTQNNIRPVTQRSSDSSPDCTADRGNCLSITRPARAPRIQTAGPSFARHQLPAGGSRIFRRGLPFAGLSSRNRRESLAAIVRAWFPADSGPGAMACSCNLGGQPSDCSRTPAICAATSWLTRPTSYRLAAAAARKSAANWAESRSSPAKVSSGRVISTRVIGSAYLSQAGISNTCR